MWEEILNRLDQYYVEARHRECQELLRSLNPRKIPRIWVTRFAEMAFRVHCHLIGLKALHRFVYPENSFATPPTNKEKMIYASALYSLGSIRESMNILSKIDPKEEPEAFFYRALAGFYEWRYSESLPFLKQFVLSDKVAPQRRLIGKINIAASLVAVEDWGSAGQLLDEIEVETQRNSYLLFLGYCNELKAQVEFFQGRYEAALHFLAKAQGFLKDQGGLYLLFIEKWQVISRCFLSPTNENLKDLDNIRIKAFQQLHWETVRECDLFEAILKRDEQLIRKVVMGTPFESYRRRARRLYGENIKAIGKFYWRVGPMSGEAIPAFNPYEAGLHEKPQLLKLFEALTLDLYKPSTLGDLFQWIYPTEKFNPFSSPSRLLQSLRRLNGWFDEKNWPLKVAFKKSEFRLISATACDVLIQRGKELSTLEGKLFELKLFFADRTFTVTQASHALGLSADSVQQLLKEALANGNLARHGRGRGTNYRLASSRRRVGAA